MAESAMAAPGVYCSKAGPAGVGGPAGGAGCGSSCESYCTLLEGACPDEFGFLQSCESSCAALRDTGSLDLMTSDKGDTLQCRLLHLIAATVDPEKHCRAAGIYAPSVYCQDDSDQPPACADYCAVVMAACGSSRRNDLGTAVYESEAQCKATCDALPKGSNQDTTGDTIGCRKYHAYAAFFDPTIFCPHAGPSGDGHCGDSCDAYCTLVSRACGPELKRVLGGDAGTCLDACKLIPGAKADSGFSIAAPDGNTLECRLRSAARALTDNQPWQCAAALGEDICR